MTRIILLAALLGATLGAAPLVPKLAGEKYLSEGLSDFPWESVGLVLEKTAAAQRTYYSGFFIAEDRFLVSSSPFQARAVTGECKNETLIFTGLTHAAPDFDIANISPTHQCVKAIHKHQTLGFAIWEVKALKKAEDTKPLRWMTEELADTMKFDPLRSDYFLLGYSLGKEGASLKISEKCRIRNSDSPFQPSDLTERLRSVRWQWSSLDCGLEPGMQGGPIFFQRRGDWFVYGMAVASVDCRDCRYAMAVVTPSFHRMGSLITESLAGE